MLAVDVAVDVEVAGTVVAVIVDKAGYLKLFPSISTHRGFLSSLP